MRNMRWMIVRKAFNSFITIVLVVIMNFFLFRVIPGDPLANLRGNTRVTDEYKEEFIKEFGLDQPTYVQFVKYVENVFTFDFGNAITQPLTPAMDIILGNLQWTLILTGTSSIFMIVIGMSLGVLSAWKRGSMLDTGTMAFSLFFYAMPTFWFAMMLIILFSTGVICDCFPSGRALASGTTLEFTLESIKDMLWRLVLPATSLTVGSIAAFSVIMRGALMDVMTEEYITTARAKGLKESQVLRGHAVPNAMLPMVALIAIDLAFVVGGAFQTEVVFDYPGVGWLTVYATEQLDYPLLEGCFFLIALVVVIANFFADILLIYMDPRVKME
ncbi:MAG: ABC transporter permease [Thermoplasmata archaeon]